MARRKVTIQARELSDMNVNKISLVKRGANRIPFRITKSTGDNSMFDISNLFLQKKEAVTPLTIAIALNKTQDVALFTEALANNDITVDHVVKDGDNTLLMLVKEDLTDFDDVSALKVTDDAAVLMVHINKGLMTFPDSMDFEENISKAAFFPSYRMATDILTETIGNIAFSEGDVEVTKAAISKALDDFSVYVDGVLNTVPVTAFKAEEAVVAVHKGLLIAADKEPAKGEVKAEGSKEETEKSTHTETETDKEKPKSKPTKAKKEEEKVSTKEDGESEADKDPVTEKDEADVSKEDSSDTDVSKQIATLTTLVGEIATNVSALKTDVAEVRTDFTSQVDELKSSVKKTDEAVNGTVHSDVSGDDSSVVTATKKSDGDVWDGTLDFGEGVEVS